MQTLCRFFRAHFCYPPHRLESPHPPFCARSPILSKSFGIRRFWGFERRSKMQGRGPPVRAKSVNGQASAWAQKIPSGADPSSAKKRRWQRGRCRYKRESRASDSSFQGSLSLIILASFQGRKHCDGIGWIKFSVLTAQAQSRAAAGHKSEK
jgi:hypothetical protein